MVAEPAVATRTSLFGFPCILIQINIDCIKQNRFVPIHLCEGASENAAEGLQLFDFHISYEDDGTNTILLCVGFHCVSLC